MLTTRRHALYQCLHLRNRAQNRQGTGWQPGRLAPYFFVVMPPGNGATEPEYVEGLKQNPAVTWSPTKKCTLAPAWKLVSQDHLNRSRDISGRTRAVNGPNIRPRVVVPDRVQLPMIVLQPPLDLLRRILWTFPLLQPLANDFIRNVDLNDHRRGKAQFPHEGGEMVRLVLGSRITIEHAPLLQAGADKVIQSRTRLRGSGIDSRNPVFFERRRVLFDEVVRVDVEIPNSRLMNSDCVVLPLPVGPIKTMTKRGAEVWAATAPTSNSAEARNVS